MGIYDADESAAPRVKKVELRYREGSKFWEYYGRAKEYNKYMILAFILFFPAYIVLGMLSITNINKALEYKHNGDEKNAAVKIKNNSLFGIVFWVIAITSLAIFISFSRMS